jgi:hypothetical protein
MPQIIDSPNINIQETGKICLIYEASSNILISDVFESPVNICSPYRLAIFDTREECAQFIITNNIINKLGL